MITPRHILGASLIISWALLLAARCIGTAILIASTVGNMGASEFGWLLPAAAWASLVAGIVIVLMPCGISCSTNDGDKKKAA
jgi:hypothetical protein